MNSKERIISSLNHQIPDRLPMDFGGTPVSGMHVSCVAELREHYGLDKHLVKVSEPYQMLGEIENDLRDALGIDTVNIPGQSTIFGFKNENWKGFKTPWGQEVLVAENFNTTIDTNGDVLIYPQGDLKVPASGRMPVSGYFFDAIIRQTEFDEDNLNVDDNLEEFGLLKECDIDHFKEQAKLFKSCERAVTGGIGGTSFGDIALVPGPFLKFPKGIRDVQEWYVSTAIRQDYIHELFTKQCDFAIENLNKVKDILGDVIDIFFMCGTDFGTQTSSFCSTDTFDRLYAPYYKRLNQWIHENTNWKTFKHSCGAVADFMPHFIEAGFDIVNPVQCSASGMDPKTLKEKYGDQLTFWGAGVDTQKTLPFQTPEEVRKEVLQRCEIFSKNGGFVFNSIHNVQAETPIENIVAMIDAVHEFNGVTI